MQFAPKQPHWLTPSNIALVVFTIILVISQSIVQIQIGATEDRSHLINIAGRQRMLSQQLTKAALELRYLNTRPFSSNAREELATTLANWQAAHDTLQQDSATLGSLGNNDPTVQAMYVEIEPHFQRMVSGAECLLQPAHTCDHDAALQDILNSDPHFLNGMNAIVSEYVAESEAQSAALQQTGIIRMMLTLGALVIGVFFIVVPSTRKMRKTIAALNTSEATLRQNEQQLRSLLDSQSSYVIRTDMEGKLTYVNESWQRTFDWLPSACIGAPSMGSIYEEDHTKAIDAVTRCIAEPGKHIQVTLRKPQKNGNMMWSLWEFTAITDASGVPTEIQCIGFDITQLHQTEEALLQSESRFKTAFETGPVPMAFTSIDAEEPLYIAVNPAYCNLVGYSEYELVGKSLIQLGVVIPGPERDSRLKALDQDGKYAMRPAQIRTKQGEVRDVTISAQRSLVDGRLYDTVLLWDVTEQKRSEAMASEIERLKSGFRQQQQYSDLIKQTISTLSHDVSTPLAIISTSRDHLNLYFNQMAPEKRQEKLDAIERQVGFVQELVSDLAKVVKGTMGERPFTAKLLNLVALCQVSVDEVGESHAASERVKFVNRCQREQVCVDEILISRILLNLLTNAIKYSPEGGNVTLELSDQPDAAIQLRVIDEGIGISQDALPNIFDTFYRAQGVETITGTGLGLSIVKDCVERHHGTITVESEKGKGTTFTIVLPVT